MLPFTQPEGKNQISTSSALLRQMNSVCQEVSAPGWMSWQMSGVQRTGQKKQKLCKDIAPRQAILIREKPSANNQESQEERSTLTLHYFPIYKFGLQQKPLKNSQSYVNSQIIFVDGKRGLNLFSENTHPGFQEEAKVSGFYSGCLLSGAQADTSPQFQLKCAGDLRNNPRSRARCARIHKVDVTGPGVPHSWGYGK